MYSINKISAPITDINDAAWDTAEVAAVDVVNWSEFNHRPQALARLLYSETGLHIKLTALEGDIITEKTRQNSQVCEDNCMEFFFRPNNGDPRYLNFEFNALGTMYLGLRTGRENPVFPVEDKEYFGVKTSVAADGWSLMFSVPFEFLNRVFGAYTDVFYGNIYKCGGAVEHYLSLYPIDTPVPDFHRPEFFGKFSLVK